MAEYTRQDAEYARRVIDRLMSNESEGLDLRPDLAISDVETDVSAFQTELDFLSEIGADVPALVIGDTKVPVSLGLAMTGRADQPFSVPPFFLKSRRWRQSPFLYDWAYDFFRSLRDKRPLEGFAMIDRDEARTTFITRATDFVATRFNAVRRFRDDGHNSPWRGQGTSMLNMWQRLGGARVGTPGCNFTVSTNSNGLRVFWSGAYYVSPNNFNHPTSPTSSVLQSGTYVFGVDGGAYGSVIQWDSSAVVSLPGLPHVHLNF